MRQMRLLIPFVLRSARAAIEPSELHQPTWRAQLSADASRPLGVYGGVPSRRERHASRSAATRRRTATLTSGPASGPTAAGNTSTCNISAGGRDRRGSFTAPSGLDQRAGGFLVFRDLRESHADDVARVVDQYVAGGRLRRYASPELTNECAGATDHPDDRVSPIRTQSWSSIFDRTHR